MWNTKNRRQCRYTWFAFLWSQVRDINKKSQIFVRSLMVIFKGKSQNERFSFFKIEITTGPLFTSNKIIFSAWALQSTSRKLFFACKQIWIAPEAMTYKLTMQAKRGQRQWKAYCGLKSDEEKCARPWTNFFFTTAMCSFSFWLCCSIFSAVWKNFFLEIVKRMFILVERNLPPAKIV